MVTLVKLVMNPGHHYVVNGRDIREGEEFEVSEADVKLWEMLGRAKRAERRVQNRALDADELPPLKRGPGRPRKDESGHYNRRDMRAEDE